MFFLGAGDYLFQNEVLYTLLERIEKTILIYYTATLLGCSNGIEKTRKEKLDFWYTMKFRPVCHQAIVANKKLFLEKKFDTTYDICADQDWMCIC